MRSGRVPAIVLVLLAAFPLVRSAHAQPTRNAVVRGFAGVPWGATPDSARPVLGEPDSLSSRGDTTSWYYRREFAGMPAKMWLSFTPGDGAHSGGYIIHDPRCGTDFARADEAVLAAHPGLVAAGAPISRSPRTRSTNPDSICASGHSVQAQAYYDPEGPGSVAVLYNQDPEQRSSLVVVYVAALARRQQAPAGGVPSRADGVEITLMPGFPALRELSRRSGSRWFATLSSDREVRLIAYEAVRGSERWSADRRLSFMDTLVQNFTASGTSMGTVQTGEQLLHVDFRQRDGDMVRIGRFYGTREGPFRSFTLMYAQPGSPDAAVESAVARMLDSMRLAAPAP